MSVTMWKASALWSVFLVSLTVLAGCDSSTGTSTPFSQTVRDQDALADTPSATAEAGSLEIPASQGAAVEYVSLAEIDLAIALGPTQSEIAAFDAAADEFSIRCAQAYGYESLPEMAPLSATPEQQVRRLRRMLFDNVDLIRQYGYNGEARASSVDDGESGSAETGESGFDVPADVVGACREPIASLQREVNEEFGPDPSLDPEVYQFVQIVAAQPSLDAVNEEWTMCMASRGYPAASLTAPIDPVTTPVAQAVADYECRIETNLTLETTLALKAAVIDWVNTNPDRVQQSREYWAELARRMLELRNVEIDAG